MSRKISLMDHLAFVTSWVNQPLGRVPKSIRCASNVMRSWLHWVKVVPWWDPLNGFWVALSTIKSQTNTLTGKQQREGGGGRKPNKHSFPDNIIGLYKKSKMAAITIWNLHIWSVSAGYYPKTSPDIISKSILTTDKVTRNLKFWPKIIA